MPLIRTIWLHLNSEQLRCGTLFRANDVCQLFFDGKLGSQLSTTNSKGLHHMRLMPFILISLAAFLTSACWPFVGESQISAQTGQRFVDRNLAFVVPAAAPQINRLDDQIFDHAEGEHNFRLVVPSDLRVIRGILIVAPYSGGDSRGYHEQVWYREFLSFHGFAFLGASNFYLHDYAVLQAALKQLASDSQHPELIHAPFAVTGFSAGGGFTRRLMKEDPDRVIAGVVVGSTMKLNGELTDVHRRVPMCVINGELEHDPGDGPGMAKQLEPVLADQRPKGARWSWMAVQGVGHEVAGQEVLSMPILDAAVRLRYPQDADVRKGPVKLKEMELNVGWVADNASWATGLTTITPANRFRGNLAKSSWLLNEDIAFIYRAYSTLDWPLKITSPHREEAKDHLYKAGATVTLQVDESKFVGWKKLELYDGANKVGELNDEPATFTVTKLSKGYHAFSILGTDANNLLRTSNPVLVVVR